MIRKPKKVIELAPKQEPVKQQASAVDDSVLKAMAEQSQALNNTVAEAAAMLAQVIAKNKPADGYLFTVQRDDKGRVSGLVAKRGRNAN
jgi:hypothetical protein